MDRTALLSEVNEIFVDVMDEEVKLTEATNALDIEDWDSLNNIQIIFQIEKKYGIKFSAAEIQGFKNVGDMISGIVEKSS